MVVISPEGFCGSYQLPGKGSACPGTQLLFEKTLHITGRLNSLSDLRLSCSSRL